MGFAHYAATVLEFFGRASFATELAEDPRSARVEGLARARQRFAMGPALAAACVTDVRAEAGLRPWKLPEQLRIRTAAEERASRRRFDDAASWAWPHWRGDGLQPAVACAEASIE
jgi:hypothetical protein